MESCFGRALLKSPLKGLPWKLIIPWIPQIRLPTETQQTPDKAPKRFQPGLDLDTSLGELNWIPHVKRELYWRALLEGPRIHLILIVKTHNSTQFSGFFLSKSKFYLKKEVNC